MGAGGSSWGWDLEGQTRGELKSVTSMLLLPPLVSVTSTEWVTCLGSDEAPDADPEGTLWETFMVPCICECLILASNEASVWVLKLTTGDSVCFSAAKDRNLSQFYVSKIKKLLPSLTGKALGMNRCKVH